MTDNCHPQWCDDIGEAYVSESWQRQPYHVRSRAFREMADVNSQLFDSIPVDVTFVSDDPYSDYADMKQSVTKSDTLKIFSGGDVLRYMTQTENLKGRAVHDWYGHLSHDCDFSPEGEFTKWYRMVDHYPPNVTQVLFGEVVAQVAAVHHVGGFGYKQRPCIAPTCWIEQVCQHYDKAVPEGAYYYQ